MTEKELEKIFKALANRRRLLVLKFLKKQGDARVGDIADAIKLSFKSTSRHLSVLANAGLTDSEQKGVQVRYSLARRLPEPARRILNLL